ncbi:MAG: hypothetical protein AAFQ98_20670 [Bacteroidota bacterium]
MDDPKIPSPATIGSVSESEPDQANPKGQAEEEDTAETFDFGGLSEDMPDMQRFLGCGG